jgi:hypothetical protein
MKKVLFVILVILPFLGFTQTSPDLYTIAKVKIANQTAIEEIGGDVIEVKFDAIDLVRGNVITGSNVVVTGHGHDAMWKMVPGILKNDFWFTDYVPSINVGGPAYMDFFPETKWYLNAIIIEVYQY